MRKTAAKIGRPTDNPKPNRVVTRMDDETFRILITFCKANGIQHLSEGVRRAIRRLDGK